MDEGRKDGVKYLPIAIRRLGDVTNTLINLFGVGFVIFITRTCSGICHGNRKGFYFIFHTENTSSKEIVSK